MQIPLFVYDMPNMQHVDIHADIFSHNMIDPDLRDKIIKIDDAEDLDGIKYKRLILKN